MNFKFDIAPELTDKLKIGAVGFENLNIQKQNLDLSEEIQSLCRKLAEIYPNSESAHQILKPMRELYRNIGIDPTKTRPSSEALFRRAIKDKPLYQINSLVDTCNLCSLSFMLSIGLYDTDKIEGDIISVRLGIDGDRYQGIGKESVNLAGKIALFDKTGPFGNPSADSFRTRITLETKNALFVLFAPKRYDDGKFSAHLNLIEEKVLQFHEATVVNFNF
jgi:DNA/RNA-binding domain of Phe-tRNA-synthetase-like protein